MENGACPACGRHFPLVALVEHAETCKFSAHCASTSSPKGRHGDCHGEGSMSPSTGKKKHSRITHTYIEYTSSSDDEDTRSSYLETIGATLSASQCACVGDYIACGHGGVGQFGLPLRRRDSKLFFQPVSITHLRGCFIRKVACGARHSVFLTEDGSVFSCGNNNLCQTGHPLRPCASDRVQFVDRPTRLVALEDKHIIDVDCGMAHSAAVSWDGNVFTFGFDGNNQLGRAGGPEPAKVTGVLDEPFVKYVSCGGDHTLVLDITGNIYAWGKGADGQLGYGVGFDHVAPKMLSPRLIPPEERVVQIEAGANFSLALTSSGNVYSWGSSFHGSTGQGWGGGVAMKNLADVFEPTLIKALSGKGVVSVFAGWNHAGAITSAGQLYMWGQGTYGQLGLGEFENPAEAIVRTPSLVRGNLTGQRVIQGCECTVRHHNYTTGGQYMSAIITDMREMVSFGYNRYGQLGNGRDDKRIFDPKFSLVSCRLKFVACGSDHSIALPYIPVPSPVGNAMLTILNKKIFSDVKFLLPPDTGACLHLHDEPSVVHAHQFILRSRSEVFRDMFTPPLADAVIPVGGVSYLGFHAFLQFIYTDYVRVSEDTVTDLELLAARYGVRGLGEMVHHFRKTTGTCGFSYPPGFSCSLEGNLVSELNVEDQSDVIFLLGSDLGNPGHIVHAHKAMLYARARDMCTALNICLDGATDDELSVEVVVVEASIDIPAFLRILRFIYSDEVRVPPHHALSILSVARQLCVPRRCSDVCENVLICQYLMTENVGFVLTTANTYGCSRVREACLALIERKWDELAGMGFMGIPVEDLHSIAGKLGKLHLFEQNDRRKESSRSPSLLARALGGLRESIGSMGS